MSDGPETTDPTSIDISEYQAMRSAAGWYVGRTCFDTTIMLTVPYSRDSHYMATEEEAEAWLKAGEFNEL